jgi:hypothetical protein
MQAMLAEEYLVGGEGGVGARVDPHRVDPENANVALFDQPVRGLGREARVVHHASGILVPVGRRVVPPVLETGPRDDGAAGRDRSEGILPPADLRGAEGEIGIAFGHRPHVEHDRRVEEVDGVQVVRGRLAGVEMGRRGPVRPGLLADRERLQVVAVLVQGGGRADLDRRITGEHRCALVDDVAEEDDPAEAERSRVHDARSGLVWAGVRVVRGRGPALAGAGARASRPRWRTPGQPGRGRSGRCGHADRA